MSEQLSTGSRLRFSYHLEAIIFGLLALFMGWLCWFCFGTMIGFTRWLFGIGSGGMALVCALLCLLILFEGWEDV